MLSLKNVTVTYGDFVALDNISLQLEANHIHGLIGQNGAGKTTLLHTLYGFLDNQSGDITWNDRPLITTDIAYLPAESYFYPRITGREYLKLISLKNPGFNISSWNRVFNLPLDNLIESYSSGMKKKLSVMGVLTLKRPIIMMDEPFNKIDITTNHLLETILTKLVIQGKTVLLTSHVLESLTSICNQIHVIDRGKIEQSFDRRRFSEIKSQLFKKQDILLNENLENLTR